VSAPLLLDLFCKAGGATHGYQRAGFRVVGVDIAPQPNYCGDAFVQADALTFPLDGFDAIHASPPCQADLKGLGIVNRRRGRDYAHASHTDAVRARLVAAGVPYVIEQPQQGAKLINPVVYCGSSFGLPIRRHRQFECSALVLAPPCDHGWQTEKKYWTSWVKNGVRQRATVVQVYGNGGERHEWGPALGIGWMTPEELTQAIPPAYTEHLGRQLLAHVLDRRAAA
jgi:DNA (cytosine-5)-methyltransferase 1